MTSSRCNNTGSRFHNFFLDTWPSWTWLVPPPDPISTHPGSAAMQDQRVPYDWQVPGIDVGHLASHPDHWNAIGTFSRPYQQPSRIIMFKGSGWLAKWPAVFPSTKQSCATPWSDMAGDPGWVLMGSGGGTNHVQGIRVADSVIRVSSKCSWGSNSSIDIATIFYVVVWSTLATHYY